MKKKSFTLLVATTVAGGVLFSSCIGSFGLTSKLLHWNKQIDSKFVNELVFIAFWIIPVYEIAAVADLLVLNSIEFWSGDNPVADIAPVKTIETESGVYTVETHSNGYHIEKEGEAQPVDLVFDPSDKTWSVEADGETTRLLQFKSNDEVVMFLPDGNQMNVELNEAGILAFRQVANGYTFYAAR
ncbi:MAG: DUF3332 domain-containing protein [Tannerellaceae bacterium]|nr:DUF3332 domain-containing protein [Tannerellaceae bacterium]